MDISVGLEREVRVGIFIKTEHFLTSIFGGGPRIQI